MSGNICLGRGLKCSFGTTPSALNVIPKSLSTVNGLPAATVLDAAPIVNILPFGFCNAPTNPAFIAAHSLPVPPPVPCIPIPLGPWTPIKLTALWAGPPMLLPNSKLMCQWAGIITILPK